MHHHRLCRLSADVAYMYPQLRCLTVAHVVEFKSVPVGKQCAYRVRIISRVILHLSHHNTLHSEHQRFVAPLGAYVGILVEVPHLSGVERHSHHELLTCRNIFMRKLSRHASATCLHIAYAHASVPVVSQLEFSRHRHVVFHLPAVHHVAGSHQILCLRLRGKSRKHSQYDYSFVHQL